ncbi:MAG: serine/threonine-protein kinase [Solirubrobacteraceae bacterium]
MPDLIQGATLAGCRLEELAGRGGMGVVWRATQLALNRPVAIKVIAPRLAEDVAFRERFQRESQLAASIEHPNVIPVYEAGELEGTLYLIMRWVHGTDLRARLLEYGPLGAPDTIRLLRPVASALAAAHRRGLIHRDIKPANVLIATGDQDQDEQVYLTDFGIARRSDTQGMTRTGVLVGTVDYMSPERIEGGKGTPASDIYAFGCMLFETLTGQVPFDRPADLAKMFAHINDPVPTDGLPPSLAPVVEKALAKRPEDRFASASELAAALDQAAAPTTAAAAPGAPDTDPGATVLAPPDPIDPTVMAPAAAEPLVPEVPPATPTVPPAAPVTPATAPASPAATPPAATPSAATPSAARPPATAPTTPTARPPRSRTPLLLVGGLLAAAAVVAVVIALSGGGGSSASSSSAAPPAANQARASVSSGTGIHVGTPRTLPGPTLAITAGGKNAWAATSGRLSELGSGADTPVVAQVSVPGPATGAAIDDSGRVWLAGLGGGGGASQSGPHVVLAGSDSRALTLGSAAAWIAGSDPGSVGRVDLGPLGAPQQIHVKGPVAALGNEYSRTWVAATDGTVTVLDADGAVNPVAAPNVTPGTVGITSSNGVWFLSSTGQLDRINPIESQAVSGRYKGHLAKARVGAGAGGLGSTSGDDSIWVLSRADRTLTRIGTNGSDDEQVIGQITFTATPGHLAVGDHVAWVDIPTTHQVFPITF